jgi:hypothetical protein
MKATTNWEGIDSAPKDGTHILLWDGEDIILGLYASHKIEEFRWSVASDGEGGLRPTHWQPLPPAPQQPNTGE